MKITNDTMQNRPSNGVDAPTNHGAQLTEQGSRFSHLMNDKKQTKYHQINDGLVLKPNENNPEKTTIKQEERVISHSQQDEFLTSDYDFPKKQQNPIIAAKGVDDNVSAQIRGANNVTSTYQACELSLLRHEPTVACCDGFEHLIIPLEHKSTTTMGNSVGWVENPNCTTQAQPVFQLIKEFSPQFAIATDFIEQCSTLENNEYSFVHFPEVFQLAEVSGSKKKANINQTEAVNLPLQIPPNNEEMGIVTAALVNRLTSQASHNNVVASQIFMPEPSHGFRRGVLNDIAFSKDVNDLLHNNQLNITVKGELPTTIHWAHAPQKVLPSLEAALENLSDSINEVASSVSLQSTPHALPSVEQIFRAQLKSIDQIHIVENFKSHFAQIDEAILKQSPSLSISLESQYLQGGKVQIDIEQGRLTIHFDVSSSHVLAQLTQSLPDLKLVLNERYPQFNTQFSMNDSDQQRRQQEERDEQAEGEQS
ncbi:MAG: hypothetical protein VX100_04595 [Pseudomonadota bacterium]|nr:hypothetical protein [Pseudomonadota bacterium]